MHDVNVLLFVLLEFFLSEIIVQSSPSLADTMPYLETA